MSAIRIAVFLSAMSQALMAQWLNYPNSRTPRTKDGKPNLSAPAPHVNGKPDLSGVWAATPPATAEQKQLLGEVADSPLQADLQFVSKYALNLFTDVKPEDQPVRPETAELVKQRAQNFGADSQTSHCLPGGVPFSTLIAPWKMIQTPSEIVMLMEDNNPSRQIHLDGRGLPKDPWPSWMGYSTGKWQSDTLVVDTIGFNDRAWLDAAGHPRSESMHITERFHRRDFGHMDLEMTFDDPKFYTRPFTIKTQVRLLPDTDVLESVCAENEKDRVHFTK